MAQFIYTMQKVRKAHGDKVILDDVTLSFLPGAKIGVVGPNGAGKSTVLRIMAGLDHASNGDAALAPGATVGMLQQEPPLDDTKTVRENVEDAVVELRGILARFDEVSAAMGEPDADFDTLLAEQGDLMEKIEHADGWELDSRIEQAMDALRCPPGDEPVVHLSGGERRRVALCKLLLQAPDLLLLDEPTNHLDAESVQWLEQHLAKYPGAILAVTHDRYFLDNVADWILEIDRGHTYPYEGNYSTYLEKKAERLALAGRKDIKLQKRLKEELEWVRSNAKGRQTKSKSRLARYEEMATEAEKTRKLDFEEIQIPPGPRMGSIVVEVSHLDKGFDGRLLVKDLSFSLPRGGIVGVIGPNGVGKTTLFKTIVGLESADSGEVKVGETIKISYVDQNRSGIDPKKSVWQTVSDGLDYLQVGQVEMPSRAYIGAFGFKGPDQQKLTGVLSGGER
ncbi:MAG: ettA, partial [Pseudonocardiales bacterium]|nr:ettA [Pseudonocardiales bacterium]